VSLHQISKRGDPGQRADPGQGPNLSAIMRVQAMPPLRRALLSREALFYAGGKKVAFGPREARLRKFLAVTGRGGMIAISLLLLAKRSFVGYKVSAKRSIPAALFVGIGAMRERTLRENVEAELGFAPHFVDQRTDLGYAGLPAPRLEQIIKHWMRTIREAIAITGQREPVFGAMDTLSTLTMRLHELAYLMAWFENLRRLNPDISVSFSTADIPAHAACILGMKVEYQQHGFLARHLVFPDFSTMVALTALEGRHVAEQVSRLTVKIAAPHTISSHVEPTLAFIGDYGSHDPDPINSLVESALAHGLHVVVRPHPRGDDGRWDGLRSNPNIIFDTNNRFEDFLDKWRPAFVASWFSTTLLDGLLAGAMPITLSHDNDALALPMCSMALSWPSERSQIEKSMLDENERQNIQKRFMKAIQ